LPTALCLLPIANRKLHSPLLNFSPLKIISLNLLTEFKEMSKKLIRFDWAIKRLLRNKANFAVLEGFLSELLFESITIKQILESEGNQETENDKFNRVDILTENSKNELIIIEIQNTYEIDYFQRMTYGVSKNISENLSLGQAYENIKKVISVNIVYFDLGQGKDYIYQGKTEFKGLHEKDILELSHRQKEKFLKENVCDIFPEYYLLKVNNFIGNAKDTLDEWIYFLKNSEVQQGFKAKGLKEAEQVLDIMRLEKDDQYSYNRHLDNLHLKASEMISLREEAEYKVKVNRDIENATNGINEGFDNLTISKITKLSLEQIEKLRTDLGK
jgi:predicted transposase/invertase (TIGR01784 family)